jgi:hypothetical protein
VGLLWIILYNSEICYTKNVSSYVPGDNEFYANEEHDCRKPHLEFLQTVLQPVRGCYLLIPEFPAGVS